MAENELARAAAHRLAIIRHAQEVTGNVSMICRYYGITRQVFYKWLRRYEEQGLEGLRDRSPRPHEIPHQSARSSTSDGTTTSDRTRSRCISSATTTSRSHPRGSGGS